MASTSSLQSRCVYAAASANRASHVADWAAFEQGKVAEAVYASNRNVVIARGVGLPHPSPAQLIPTKNGVLTSVKFAYSGVGHGEPHIVAGSRDGYLYLFKRRQVSDPGSDSAWELQHEWKASKAQASQAQHQNARVPGRKLQAGGASAVEAIGVVRYNALAATSGHEQGLIFASATSDGMLQMWRTDSAGNPEQIQELSLGRQGSERRTEVLPLDIAFACLPSSGTSTDYLLTVAGTDSKIKVFVADGRQLEFQRAFSLLGHSDWVRSIDICQVYAGTDAGFMLASGSQDHTVRLWRLTKDTSAAPAKDAKKNETLDSFDRLAAEMEDKEDKAIETKVQTFSIGSTRWTFALDALLTAHEHWVTGVRWAPGHRQGQPCALLSSSADNSVILWTPASAVTQMVSSLQLPIFESSAQEWQAKLQDEEDVWVTVQRFGELGMVGSAANGMYGVAWEPPNGQGARRQAVLAHGYGGALQVWSRREDENGTITTWQAQPGLGGHFGPATSVRWEPGGQYILSGSSDKTTRLHGQYRSSKGTSWHEVARPQTHGYEIAGLAWTSRLSFASAGDEKVIRLFEAPQGFVQSAQSLGLCSSRESSNVVVLKISTLSDLTHPDRFGDCIKEATRRSLAKGRLDVLVISPLFDGIESGQAPEASFEQLESFLKWCYAMSWSTAVESDNLLFDVDVVLIGSQQLGSSQDAILRQNTAFAEDADLSNLESLLQNADVTPLVAEDEGRRATRDTGKSMEQHEAIAMGGTFDHLHVGHKILLSIACLLATRRVVVGVTGDSMLSKKKEAQLLESTQDRIERVAGFMARFSKSIGRPSLKHDVVELQDVAGPAGTDADLTALLFTDETIGGADFIDKERDKRNLKRLDRFSIGVIGASGETDVKGKDAGELAAAKVGSTAIRQWLAKHINEKGMTKGQIRKASRLPALSEISTLNGEPRPVGASVPPLGLSNRALFEHGSNQNAEPHDGPSASGQNVGKSTRSIATRLERPPVEEQLHNNSIWSEVNKIYGHSLELSAIDVHQASRLIASSSQARDEDKAGIHLHDGRQSWKDVQVLSGHKLGATRVRFSPDGINLVSASRDRSWRLYTKTSQEDGDANLGEHMPFRSAAAEDEAHARIIYDAAWIDNDSFATASRDGTIKTWSLNSDEKHAVSVHCSSTITIKKPVTAVAVSVSGLLAAGDEAGTLSLFQKNEGDWKLLHTIQALHAGAISELAWQPDPATNPLLASAGSDGAVQVIEIAAQGQENRYNGSKKVVE